MIVLILFLICLFVLGIFNIKKVQASPFTMMCINFILTLLFSIFYLNKYPISKEGFSIICILSFIFLLSLNIGQRLKNKNIRNQFDYNINVKLMEKIANIIIMISILSIAYLVFVNKIYTFESLKKISLDSAVKRYTGNSKKNLMLWIITTFNYYSLLFISQLFVIKNKKRYILIFILTVLITLIENAKAKTLFSMLMFVSLFSL